MEVKLGYKITAVGIAPQEWVEVSVGSLIQQGIIAKPLDGNHGSIHPKSSDFVDYGIPFVMANNVQNGSVDLVNCAFIKKEQADSLQKGFSKPGDILLTHKATIGNTAIIGKIPYPYIMLTPQVTYYRVADKNRLSNSYLRHYFDSAGFQAVLRGLAGGGTRAYIGISAQRQLPIVLPPDLYEQQAIAEALSDVDALLGGVDRLISKKRDLKQATMQQLLTGQTRLSGFNGEWEVKTLGEVFEITSSKRVFQSEWRSEGIPFYRARELAVLGTNGVVDNELFITPELYNKHRRAYGVPGFGDMLVTGVGTLGKVYVVSNDQEFYFKDGNIIWFKIEGKMSAEFLRQLYLTDTVMKQVAEGGAGTTVGTYTISSAKKTSIPFPTLPEQTAIAEVLTEMDAEIAALEQRREKTRDLKQAMMQELLTGKTRLI